MVIFIWETEILILLPSLKKKKIIKWNFCNLSKLEDGPGILILPRIIDI